MVSEIQATEWGLQEQCHGKTYMHYMSSFPEVGLTVISMLSWEQITNSYLPKNLLPQPVPVKKLFKQQLNLTTTLFCFPVHMTEQKSIDA